MKNLLVETLANQINESSTNSDNANFGSLILPLVKKIYSKSLISQICDTEAVKTSTAKIAALYSLYTGNDNSAINNSHIENSYIIEVNNITGLNINDTITINSSTFIIRYIEESNSHDTVAYKRLLISRETGTHIPIKNDTFGSSTISFSTINRAAIKKLFKRYTGSYALANDMIPDVKYLGFETRTVTIDTVTRKIRTKFSQEQLQDLLAVYKEKGIELASEYISNEVHQEIDKELITYMKFIAKQTTTDPINLALSYGAYKSGSLSDISYDIVSNIYLAAEQIVKDTKRNRTVFILADPITASFLQTNAFHTSVEPEDGNPYKIGKLGIYPLYVDLFAEPGEHYVLVGYSGSFKNNGDSGIIYAPYTTNLYTNVDSEFKENIMYVDRYAMLRHPQDSGNIVKDDPWNSSNGSNSDFFKMFFVDFSSTINTESPNGVSNFNSSIPLFN